MAVLSRDRNATAADRLLHTYLAVLDEFNASGFAAAHALKEHPKAGQIAEINALARLLPEGGTLLDIGTGTGVVPMTFHRLGRRVVSVDLGGSDRLRDALQRIKDLGVEGHWAEVGEEPIPLPDASVDVAFAGDVVEHLPNSPRPFMRELARVLRPGGWCVLTTPNAVRLSVRLKVLLGHSNWMPLSEIYDGERNYGHHKEYEAAEFAALFRLSGFADIRIEMIEDTLRRGRLAASWGDIRTQNRFRREIDRVDRFDALNPVEYARVGLLGAALALPGLRSTMLGRGRKPVTE
jgi:SAM-dependent methyltransferase